MTKTGKTLERMQNNPRDWQMTELAGIATRFGITVRKTSGSHVTFTHPKWVEILTIPAHRPVKRIYVKRFVTLIEALKGEDI